MSYVNGLFYSMVIFGPLVSISSSSWVLCWSGMEIGFLGLVPLLLGGGSFSTESSMKYFFVQSVASAFLISSGVMIFVLSYKVFFWMSVCLLSLCLKLGAFPGHFWVPTVLSGLSWESCCVLLGPPKFGPLAFLGFLSSSSKIHDFVLFVAVFSALIGALMGLNQTTIRGMMGASSISHTGWLVMGVLFGSFWLYISVYLSTLILLFYYLEEENWKGSSLVLLSMSGLPPFVMFIAKIGIVFQVLNYSNSWSFIVFPLAGALLSLYFYLKFSYSFYMQESEGASLSPSLLSLLFMNIAGAVWLTSLI